jgi:hypothetical protein
MCLNTPCCQGLVSVSEMIILERKKDGDESGDYGGIRENS